MNGIDIALVGVVALFALRGYWRGFFRETCGLVGLFGGVIVAIRLAPECASWLEPRIPITLAREALAFVGVFVVAYSAANLAGWWLERSVGGGVVSRILGVAIGAGKGGVLLAVLLLFLHLFPVSATVDARIMESRVAPPLIAAASSVIQANVTTVPPVDGADRT